ncbi:hypothetical protein [Planobispora takensis]|uniref:Serine protease n=1 Tax=Planobispora takensis TaxID=1367882 RepID=A0A8J3T094_9ACTN|nr:hypothetical protein [Planobispora takensis]GII02622.1 hypothetical protein Pta02_46300 [Planobispora takensis]
MKRILLPAGGAILATGLLAAGLAGTAQAAPDWATDPMAKNTAEAESVAQFWTKSNNEALKQATAYYWDEKQLPKLVSGGGYSPDGKAGAVLPTGEAKVTTPKVKNINLPKTIGKVFFVNNKGDYKWCSATSIHAKYRNLVATAGHCVYDVENNGHTLDKWVFVPGYYQGKTPWGIYVGKQAWTHYDFDVYEDYDRDYAFVTVYNGVHYNGDKTVTADEYKKFVGPKYIDIKEVSAEEGKAGHSKYGDDGPYYSETTVANNVETVNPPQLEFNGNDIDKYTDEDGYKDVKLIRFEVTKYDYDKAAPHSKKWNNGEQYPVLPFGGKWESISKETYEKLKAEKAAGKFLGELKTVQANGVDIEWYSVQYFVKKWIKSSTVSTTKWYLKTYHIELSKDAGRLGDNVGGQGFAWNQKTGQPVYIFGYPAAAHGDGNKPFTGVTPKWCYGKPSGKVYVSAAQKVEEHVGLKCSMTPGADGSPWLIKYNNAKRLGLVNGVTSLFGDQDANGRYDLSTSAYFDGETAAIYAKAANVWSGRIVGANGELYK